MPQPCRRGAAFQERAEPVVDRVWVAKLPERKLRYGSIAETQQRQQVIHNGGDFTRGSRDAAELFVDESHDELHGLRAQIARIEYDILGAARIELELLERD